MLDQLGQVIIQLMRVGRLSVVSAANQFVSRTAAYFRRRFLYI